MTGGCLWEDVNERLGGEGEGVGLRVQAFGMDVLCLSLRGV